MFTGNITAAVFQTEQVSSRKMFSDDSHIVDFLLFFLSLDNKNLEYQQP